MNITDIKRIRVTVDLIDSEGCASGFSQEIKYPKNGPLVSLAYEAMGGVVTKISRFLLPLPFRKITKS
jgi:hypothetical protein